MRAPRPVEFDPTMVRDISEIVYRDRMGDKDANELVARVGTAKFREWAGAFDTLTRAYLRAVRPV